MSANGFATVISEELKAIKNARDVRKIGGQVYEGPPRPPAADPSLRDVLRDAGEMNLTALALSGGGIRSATFNLGVLQALARHGLLNRFDYLSTVSGGGYIGTWLVAWLKREIDNAQLQQPQPADLAEAARKGVEQVRQALDESEAMKLPETSGVRPIDFLRQYGNFLTPKIGLFSADTWSFVAIYVRNVILNQAVLVAAIGLALLLFRLPLIIAMPESWQLAVFGGLVLCATVHIGLNLSSLSTGSYRKSSICEAPYFTKALWVQLLIVTPVLIASAMTAKYLPTASRSAQAGFFNNWPHWMPVFLSVGFLTLFLSIASRFWKNRSTTQPYETASIVIAASASSGLLVGVLYWALVQLFASPPADLQSWNPLIWGTPLALLSISLSIILYLGVMGKNFPDAHREWWSRLGAWFTIYLLGWTALFTAALYAPLILQPIVSYDRRINWAAAAAWILSGVGGALVGRRPSSGGKTEAGWIQLWIVRIAPIVFVAGLILVISTVVHFGLHYQTETDTLSKWQSFTNPAGDYATAHWEMVNKSEKALPAALLALLGALLLLAWRVDINEFSMHHFYRNRLIRCYLGASHKRRPHPFMGFDSEDDIPLDQFDAPTYIGPYPILNATLNLAGGEQLAWQERKAASFVFTPKFCGFEIGADANDRRTRGYRPTSEYAGRLHLGTCMAISGAAVSPNWGSHSSAAVAFLMTMFNVRLGWWLGNPSTEKKYRKSGPAFGLMHLFKELFGSADERSNFVYVSDGGHFENLGLYELVRRRCRFILLSDAGQDPSLRFDDLGSAIRKIRTDLKIDIEMNLTDIRIPEAQRQSRWHCAVGKIRYDQVDDNALPGTIVYLKSSLTGDEDSDILNFGDVEPTFPHHSTADQWFSETQFESYRRLGYHVASTVFGPAMSQPDVLTSNADYFRGLAEAWYTPSPAVAASFSKHGASIDQLFERARKDPVLNFLDEQFYPEWRQIILRQPPVQDPVLTVPCDPEKLRSGFYFCVSLVQLMERVYVDLDLAQNARHPDNRGWMNLFRHWSWSGMFRLTWAICASTLGARFQTFCRSELDLSYGENLRVVMQKSMKKDDLNFFERTLVELAERKMPEMDCGYDLRLYVFFLTVPNVEMEVPEGRTRAQFNFGFALLDGTTIVAVRIQDHLRRMGLGSRAMKALVEAVDARERPNLTIAPPKLYQDFVKVSAGAQGPLAEQLQAVLKQAATDDAVKQLKWLLRAAQG